MLEIPGFTGIGCSDHELASDQFQFESGLQQPEIGSGCGGGGRGVVNPDAVCGFA